MIINKLTEVLPGLAGLFHFLSTYKISGGGLRL